MFSIVKGCQLNIKEEKTSESKMDKEEKCLNPSQFSIRFLRFREGLGGGDVDVNDPVKIYVEFVVEIIS